MIHCVCRALPLLSSAKQSPCQENKGLCNKVVASLERDPRMLDVVNERHTRPASGTLRNARCTATRIDYKRPDVSVGARHFMNGSV